MDFTPLSRFIEHLTSWRIPWAEILITHRNQEVYRYRHGFEDLEAQTPIRENGIINLYSLTKIMTCTAGLQLLERGKYLLNDPLAAYMPEFADMTVMSTSANGQSTLTQATRQIRVRDLFTMTAGFSYNLQSPSIQAAITEHGSSLTNRQFTQALAKEPLLYEPGTHYSYSLCHDVLAALVEVIDGRSFDKYLQEEIIGPLGMNDTGFDLTADQEKRLVPQYVFDDQSGSPYRQDGNPYRISSAYHSGGAGLLSTVDDYMRFLQVLTNKGTATDGTRILSAQTIDLMRTDHLDSQTRLDFNWDHMKGYGYGLGVRTHVSKSASGLLSPHGEFGWSGAAGCMALIDPESELTVMYAQHMLNSQEPYVQPRLKNIIYSCL